MLVRHQALDDHYATQASAAVSFWCGHRTYAVTDDGVRRNAEDARTGIGRTVYREAGYAAATQTGTTAIRLRAGHHGNGTGLGIALGREASYAPGLLSVTPGTDAVAAQHRRVDAGSTVELTAQHARRYTTAAVAVSAKDS